VTRAGLASRDEVVSCECQFLQRPFYSKDEDLGEYSVPARAGATLCLLVRADAILPFSAHVSLVVR